MITQQYRYIFISIKNELLVKLPIQVNKTSLEKDDRVSLAVPLLQAAGDKVSLLCCRDPTVVPFASLNAPATIDEEDETMSIKDSAV